MAYYGVGGGKCKKNLLVLRMPYRVCRIAWIPHQVRNDGS